MNAVLPCDSDNEKATGKRSAGNPHAAFDEGSLGNTLAPTLLSIRGSPLILLCSFSYNPKLNFKRTANGRTHANKTNN